jgi:hypothetical protein
MLFGPAPEWKKLAFLGFFFSAALVLYVGRSRPQRQLMAAVLLAVIAVLFVLVMYVFH